MYAANTLILKSCIHHLKFKLKNTVVLYPIRNNKGKIIEVHDAEEMSFFKDTNIK